MKRGETACLKVDLDISLDLVAKIIFALNNENTETDAPTLKKEYPSDTTVVGGIIYIPLNQTETMLFGKVVRLEGQIEFKDKSVVKTDIVTFSFADTIYTEVVSGNTPNVGQPNCIPMTIDGATYINISLDTMKSNLERSETAANLAVSSASKAQSSQALSEKYKNWAADSSNSAYSSEITAQEHALSAKNSSDSALASKTSAETAATASNNSAIKAAESAQAAATSETNSAQSAVNAAASVAVIGTAETIATNVAAAAQSAASAEVSATNAGLAKTAAETARAGAESAKNTSVEQANAASLNKDMTDSNVTTTANLATQVSQDKQIVGGMVTEGRALLEEQRRLIGSMPTTYIAKTIDEMQSIDSPIARDICLVLGTTQAAYMFYTTAIDGTPLSNPAWVWVSDIQMVAPTKDYLLNILQLPVVATSGSYNDLTDKPNRYESYMTVADGIWDYSVTDKIKLTADLVSISNEYNGAVGMIQSDIDITLPTNSKKAIDYDYMDLAEGQMWQYTFVHDGSYYHWSRVVIA